MFGYRNINTKVLYSVFLKLNFFLLNFSSYFFFFDKNNISIVYSIFWYVDRCKTTRVEIFCRFLCIEFVCITLSDSWSEYRRWCMLYILYRKTAKRFWRSPSYRAIYMIKIHYYNIPNIIAFRQNGLRRPWRRSLYIRRNRSDTDPTLLKKSAPLPQICNAVMSGTAVDNA